MLALLIPTLLAAAPIEPTSSPSSWVAVEDAPGFFGGSAEDDVVETRARRSRGVNLLAATAVGGVAAVSGMAWFGVMVGAAAAMFLLVPIAASLALAAGVLGVVPASAVAGAVAAATLERPGGEIVGSVVGAVGGGLVAGLLGTLGTAVAFVGAVRASYALGLLTPPTLDTGGDLMVAILLAPLGGLMAAAMGAGVGAAGGVTVTAGAGALLE